MPKIRKPDSPKKPRSETPIDLNDLIPSKDVSGGRKIRRTIFGSTPVPRTTKKKG